MNINFFSIICLVIAASAFIKVFFGVFYHKQLYAWAKEHYSLNKPDYTVKLLMVYALVLLVAVWIGTIFFYVPKGWILTVFISLASIKSLSLVLSWKATSEKFVKFIDNAGNKLWLVDVFVAALGVGFLLLALLLY